MRIKIISEPDESRLENALNEFLSIHNVLDIQYQMTTRYDGFGTYSAMIVYKEIADKKADSEFDSALDSLVSILQ